MLIYGNYSITAEKTITGGIPKSWCEYSPEVTCGLHPHHISGVAIDSAYIKSFSSPAACGLGKRIWYGLPWVRLCSGMT